MIKKTIAYSIVCDSCGAGLFDGTEHAGFNELSYVQQTASDSGWLTEGDRHYCPGCWSYDDNGVIVVVHKGDNTAAEPFPVRASLCDGCVDEAFCFKENYCLRDIKA